MAVNVHRCWTCTQPFGSVAEILSVGLDDGSVVYMHKGCYNGPVMAVAAPKAAPATMPAVKQSPYAYPVPVFGKQDRVEVHASYGDSVEPMYAKEVVASALRKLRTLPICPNCGDPVHVKARRGDKQTLYAVYLCPKCAASHPTASYAG